MDLNDLKTISPNIMNNRTISMARASLAAPPKHIEEAATNEETSQ